MEVNREGYSHFCKRDLARKAIYSEKPRFVWKVSVKHKMQQHVSWGEWQRPVTGCSDDIWEPMSLPLKRADPSTDTSHQLGLLLWQCLQLFCLKLSSSAEVLIVLQGYFQLSISNFYPHQGKEYLLEKLFLLPLCCSDNCKDFSILLVHIHRKKKRETINIPHHLALSIFHTCHSPGVNCVWCNRNKTEIFSKF